jgi:hypothetical protein
MGTAAEGPDLRAARAGELSCTARSTERGMAPTGAMSLVSYHVRSAPERLRPGRSSFPGHSDRRSVEADFYQEAGLLARFQ